MEVEMADIVQTFEDEEYQYGQGVKVPSYKFRVKMGATPYRTLHDAYGRPPTQEELDWFAQSGQGELQGGKDFYLPKAWKQTQYTGQSNYNWAPAAPAPAPAPEPEPIPEVIQTPKFNTKPKDIPQYEFIKDFGKRHGKEGQEKFKAPAIQFQITEIGKTPKEVLKGVLNREPTSSEVWAFRNSGQHPGEGIMPTDKVWKEKKTGGRQYNYHIPKAWLTKRYEGQPNYNWAGTAPAEAAPAEPLERQQGKRTLPEQTPPKFPTLAKGWNAITEFSTSPTGTMGWMTLLGALGDAWQSSLEAEGKASQYADKKIAELEAKEKRGELGRDRDLERDEMAEMTRPVRAIATEGRRQAEAVQAGMGETRSAAALGRISREQSRAVGEGVRQAGAVVSGRRAQRAAQEIGQLESLYQYKQQQKEKALNRIFGGVGGMMGQIGRIAAATAGKEHMSFEEFKKGMPAEFHDLNSDQQMAVWLEVRRIDSIGVAAQQGEAMKNLMGFLGQKTGIPTLPGGGE